MVFLPGAALLVCGCSTLQVSDSNLLQGTWKGYEMGRPAEAPCRVIISGNTLEFRGASSNDWCKGTFTLRPDTNPKQLVGVMRECDDPQYVGKTVHAIYRIDADTLILAGNAPGNPEAPASFEASGCRKLVLKRQPQTHSQILHLYSQISAGMTQQEVEKILGPPVFPAMHYQEIPSDYLPSGVAHPEGDYCWYWREPERPLELWESPYGAGGIEIVYWGGKVIQKKYNSQWIKQEDLEVFRKTQPSASADEPSPRR